LNTKSKTKGFPGFGLSFFLILAAIFLLIGLAGSGNRNSYTRAEFEKALSENSIEEVTIVQNKEIPTGSLKIVLKNGEKETLYVSDVNEMQKLMDSHEFTGYICENVPGENWFLELLPVIVMLGAFFFFFIIMNNQAAAQGGGSKMMNFGKSRARMTITKRNTPTTTIIKSGMI
jgi:cell division protease FtsH